MRKRHWRYRAAIAVAMVCMAGGSGLSAFASEKKAEECGRNVVAGVMECLRITESMKDAVCGKREETAGSAEETGMEGIQVSEGEGSGQDITDKNVDSGEAGNGAGAEGNAGEAADVPGDGTETGTDGAEGEMDEAQLKKEAEIDAYFDDSVFVGDSIMLGFRNYAMKRQETFLSRLGFLAAGSFSANNALWEVGGESVHPVYQGEQRQVWDSIALMGSKKVFIMLGMNDLNITGLEGTCEIYEELIGKIQESNPGVEIHIMSMTYILKGKETGKLKNDIIREYNGMLKAMAEEKGWGFVNVADALADGNGDLAEEYCSDEFAHQNPEAYDVWVSVLRKYAEEQMDNA